jgi:FkbM family methyltransferase
MNHAAVARTRFKQTFFAAFDAFLRFLLPRVPQSAAETTALWWGYRYQPAPAVAKLRSGALANITENDHLQLLLYYCGQFEPECLHLMKQYLRPGSTILDVGANIGLYTIEAAKAVGSSGRVISIEASPDHAKTIERNINLNGFRNVDLISSAVGDVDGAATLTLPAGGNYGMFTLGKVAGRASGEVQIRRIDDILLQQGVRSVDFIKMDIEGSELSALKGAIKTIEQSHPPILIELNEGALESCGTSSTEVKALLNSLGYQGRIVGRNSVLPIPGTQNRHDCDECLFLWQN